jgi:hypothetical protein
MGTNPKGCFLGGMRGKNWLFFEVGRWDLNFFPKNYLFGSVGWGVWRKQMGFFFWFFFSFVIW